MYKLHGRKRNTVSELELLEVLEGEYVTKPYARGLTRNITPTTDSPKPTAELTKVLETD